MSLGGAEIRVRRERERPCVGDDSNGVGKRVFGTPFGGYKLSGLGKEGALEEILEYTRHKVIAVGLHSDAPERLLSREQG